MNRLTFEEMKLQQKDQPTTDLLSQITGGIMLDCHGGYSADVHLEDLDDGPASD